LTSERCGDAFDQVNHWIAGSKLPLAAARPSEGDQAGFAYDSSLEGGVSCELVSENAKFPASREFTGNFIDSGLGGASEAAKKGMKSVSYGPIPYAS
jgi:hypothetical protein